MLIKRKMLLTTRPSASKLTTMPGASHHHHMHHPPPGHQPVHHSKNKNSSKGNLSRKGSKLAVLGPHPLVWAGRMGHPPTLLLAGGGGGSAGNIPPPPPPPPPLPGGPHHGIRVPMTARKIVNPVTVNALKALSARVQGPVPPPPPPPPPPPGPLKQISYNTGGSTGSCCSCCYYCCCDGLVPGKISSQTTGPPLKGQYGGISAGGGISCLGCNCTCPAAGNVLKSKTSSAKNNRLGGGANSGNNNARGGHTQRTHLANNNRRRRSRSRSRETLLSSTTTATAASCSQSHSVLDLSRLIISEHVIQSIINLIPNLSIFYKLISYFLSSNLISELCNKIAQASQQNYKLQGHQICWKSGCENYNNFTAGAHGHIYHNYNIFLWNASIHKKIFICVYIWNGGLSCHSFKPIKWPQSWRSH